MPWKSWIPSEKEKCAFMTKSVNYMGYKIDSEGLRPLKEKVSAITKDPVPKNVTELKAYLGLITIIANFYLCPLCWPNFTDY